MPIGSFARGCACLALLSTIVPSLAASPETEAFVANIRLRAVFVAHASRLAADRAASPALRDFAAAEARRQAVLLSEFEGGPAPAPHDAMADLGQPRTGRSVGTDGMVDPLVFSPPPGLGAQMPAATLGLDRLASLQGAAFDSLYAKLMRGVLGDEAALFDGYGKTGDDQAFRTISARELPRLNESLAAIE